MRVFTIVGHVQHPQFVILVRVNASIVEDDIWAELIGYTNHVLTECGQIAGVLETRDRRKLEDNSRRVFV